MKIINLENKPDNDKLNRLKENNCTHKSEMNHIIPADFLFKRVWNIESRGTFCYYLLISGPPAGFSWVPQICFSIHDLEISMIVPAAKVERK